MKFNIGPLEKEHTKKLPKRQQVTITLETQKEIDQLFAMINFVPIVKAMDLRKGDWVRLRENLSASPDYLDLHNKLCKMRMV